MIYLLRKHDIISVPAYAEGIYHPTIVRYHIEDISPVPQGTDIIVKKLFCQVDKRVFYMEQGTGVEPAFTAWEAVVLPIYEPCGIIGIIAN